jgi:hypothetical protein
MLPSTEPVAFEAQNDLQFKPPSKRSGKSDILARLNADRASFADTVQKTLKSILVAYHERSVTVPDTFNAGYQGLVEILPIYRDPITSLQASSQKTKASLFSSPKPSSVEPHYAQIKKDYETLLVFAIQQLKALEAILQQQLAEPEATLKSFETKKESTADELKRLQVEGTLTSSTLAQIEEDKQVVKIEAQIKDAASLRLKKQRIVIAKQQAKDAAEANLKVQQLAFDEVAEHARQLSEKQQKYNSILPAEQEKVTQELGVVLACIGGLNNELTELETSLTKTKKKHTSHKKLIHLKAHQAKSSEIAGNRKNMQVRLINEEYEEAKTTYLKDKTHELESITPELQKYSFWRPVTSLTKWYTTGGGKSPIGKFAFRVFTGAAALVCAIVGTIVSPIYHLRFLSKSLRMRSKSLTTQSKNLKQGIKTVKEDNLDDIDIEVDAAMAAVEAAETKVIAAKNDLISATSNYSDYQEKNGKVQTTKIKELNEAITEKEERCTQATTLRDRKQKDLERIEQSRSTRISSGDLEVIHKHYSNRIQSLKTLGHTNAPKSKPLEDEIVKTKERARQELLEEQSIEEEITKTKESLLERRVEAYNLKIQKALLDWSIDSHKLTPAENETLLEFQSVKKALEEAQEDCRIATNQHSSSITELEARINKVESLRTERISLIGKIKDLELKLQKLPGQEAAIRDKLQDLEAESAAPLEIKWNLEEELERLTELCLSQQKALLSSRHKITYEAFKPQFASAKASLQEASAYIAENILKLSPDSFKIGDIEKREQNMRSSPRPEELKIQITDLLRQLKKKIATFLSQVEIANELGLLAIVDSQPSQPESAESVLDFAYHLQSTLINLNDPTTVIVNTELFAKSGKNRREGKPHRLDSTLKDADSVGDGTNSEESYATSRTPSPPRSPSMSSMASA